MLVRSRRFECTRPSHLQGCSCPRRQLDPWRRDRWVDPKHQFETTLGRVITHKTEELRQKANANHRKTGRKLCQIRHWLNLHGKKRLRDQKVQRMVHTCTPANRTTCVTNVTTHTVNVVHGYPHWVQVEEIEPTHFIFSDKLSSGWTR